MAQQGTPGPWVVHDSGWHYRMVGPVGTDNYVAAVYGPTRGHENDKPTRDANARLIAAAPELLEALLWLRSRSPIVYAMLKRAPGTGVKEIDVLDHRALDDDLLRVQQVINAAIAKATGASR